MVSVMLLTTEEVLQRNGFWYCLDSVWDTEELEPFEEVLPEHVFAKPLSRDYYYIKYPDIPRSESEEENSITVNGFRCKHVQWTSKICIRRFDAKRRNSNSSIKSRANSDLSVNNMSRRVTSLVEKTKYLHASKEIKYNENDERARAFFTRLLHNVPPPPVSDLQHTGVDSIQSIIVPSQRENEFDNIEVPNYNDFESNMLQPIENRQIMFGTSTLKKQKKVNFSLSSVNNDSASWNESIYGVAELVHPKMESKTSEILDITEESTYEKTNMSQGNQRTNSSIPVCTTWSEIMDTDDSLNDNFLSKDSLVSEEILSQSQCRDVIFADVTGDDEETEYAKFAIYKIYQTLKLEGGMIDSSPLKDLNVENVQEDKCGGTFETNSFFGSMYRLAPVDDIDDSVNSSWI